MIEAAPDRPLLIQWTLSGGGPLLGQLRSGTLSADLLAALRSEFGFAAPPRWSVGVEVEPADVLPADWYEQDTIRGDFLRGVRFYQMNADVPLGLEAYLGPRHEAGTLAARAAGSDPADRERISPGGPARRGPARRTGAFAVKIDALEIDGFGIWRGLKLGPLDEGVNLFYGPNEAGKTTLLQFIRSVALRLLARAAKLPAAAARAAGADGSLHVAGPHGRYQVGAMPTRPARGHPPGRAR